jgi:hypothetical protein
MLQAEDDLFHGDAALQAESRRLEQLQASQQAPHQRPIGRVFRSHLARLSRQQMLQCAEGMLNPTAPAPGSDQTGCRDKRLLTPPVEAVFPRVVDEDARDPSIGGTRGRESGIAEARRLRALPPGPVGPGPEVFPCDPTPIRQQEDIPALALDDHGSLLVGVDMSQQGRITKPTIRHDQWNWQPLAAALQDRPGAIQHHPQSGQFIAAGPAGPHGVWPADHEVHGDDQLPITNNDHQQQQPIDPRPDTVFLAAIPDANPPQLLASLLEHAVVTDPRPRPMGRSTSPH